MTFIQEIDLHVVYPLLPLLLIAFFLPHQLWVLIVLALMPQGRILTRALHDYPKSERPKAGYLIVNEAVVAGAIAACKLGWHFHKI